MRRHIAAYALFFLLATVPAGAAITGIVMDEEGRPLAAAKVSSYAQETPQARTIRFFSKSPERPQLAQVETDAQGRFNLATPKEAVVEIVVRAVGYGLWSRRADRNDDLGAIGLRKAPMRTGTVTAAGKPVPGATVIWSGNGESITTTGPDGRYSVPDPSKWASEVSLIHPDHAGVTEPATTNLNGSVAVDRSFAKSVPLTGKVVSADGKTPVAGAAVVVNGAPPATSSEDGSFTFPHVSEKWTVVRATLGDRIGTRVRSGSAQPVIRLSKAGLVSGTVREVKKGSPLAGAELRLRPGGRFDPAAPVAVAFTDAKGNFALEGVPAGTYTLAGIRPGYQLEPVSISVTEGEKVSRALLATQLGQISGIVMDEGKRGVARASVSSRNLSRESMMMFDLPAQGGAATSGPDGTFAIHVAPDIEMQLSATRKGYPPARSATLKVAPGERRSGIVLTIPAGMPVTGRVTDADGKPLGDVAVQAAESNPNAPAMIVQRMILGDARQQDDAVKTAKDGTFTIRLKEGSYDIGFRLEGFATKVARAVQVSGSTRPLEITLQPGVEVSGRVVRAGQGVPEVRIFSMGESATAMAETAADGSFRLTDLVPGQMRLSVNKPDEFIQQLKMVTAPASDVVIEIPQGGRISGQVVDKSSRAPLTNFEAGIGSARGGGGFVIVSPASMRPFTSDDGSFVLDNVPPGPTQLSVRAAGYTAATVPNLTVEDGKTLAGVTVEMEHGVRLVGRVTGPDGSPLGGVSVRPDPVGGRMIRMPGSEPSATTDQNGDYAMEALEAGDRMMVFSLSGYMAERKNVSLSGDEVRLDVRMSTGMRVTGSVVTDAGVPVPDADVYAVSAAQANMGSRGGLTDQNGTFAIEGLAPGRYTFTARKSGQPTGEVRDFDISSGAPVRITLRSGGVIYGQVTGLPPEELQQAVVNASASSGGNASAAVDATGYYRIEAAPVGTVRVTARTGSGIAGGRSSAMQSVQVEPGSQVKVDIAFRADTVIRGRITRNGQPVDGAMVSFYPKDATAQTNARTSSNSSGEYEVSGLDDATYSVTVVDLQRSAPFSTTYEVRGSGTFDVDMKSATLRGRVTESDGDAVYGAMIEVREAAETGMRFAVRSAQSDASGAFSIDSITPGSYSITATKAGYGTKVVQTTVGDDGADVTITLSRNPGILLTVVDGRDGRQIAAFVHVMDMQGHVIYETAPFGGTSTEPQKLPLDPGTYRATINAVGYAAQNVSLTSPSTPTIALTPGGTIAVQSKGSELRRGRLIGVDGREYSRGFGGSGIFTIDPSPGLTTLNNVAPGTYTLQILGPAGEVTASAPVTVMEGQVARVSL